MDYTSLATQWAEPVDCRMLQMELEFFNVKRAQMRAAANFCFEETHKLLDNIFWSEWTFNSHPISVEKLCSRLVSSDGLLDFEFCGDVFSDIVYNKKTFHKYDRKLQCPVDVSWEEENISIDYREEFARIFSLCTSSAQIKSAVLDIFNCREKRMVAFWRKHDVYGHFFSFPHTSVEEAYYGKYRFSIGIGCLGAHTISFSDNLVAFACEFAKNIPFTSCRIALSPIGQASPCSGYMEYFGGKYVGDRSIISEKCNKKEWLSQNYIPGAEWFNIISSRQSLNIPDLLNRDKQYKDVFISPIAEGSFIVQSAKDIVSTDILEYASLKKVLYEGLYPGEGTLFLKDVMDMEKFGYMAKPRWRWELIPVFENEISVLPDRIVLSKGGQKGQGDGSPVP